MISKILNIFRSLFVKKQSQSEDTKVWIARNVWNDPSLAEEDQIYKGKQDES